ncbi:ribosomal protein L55-like protein, partial [Dinothrombium tinctorium]
SAPFIFEALDFEKTASKTALFCEKRESNLNEAQNASNLNSIFALISNNERIEKVLSSKFIAILSIYSFFITFSRCLLLRNLCSQNCTSLREYNANRCSITRLRQQHYLRRFQTALVLTDGSSINIRYEEPRKIMFLPLFYEDLSSTEEKQAFEARRRPIERIRTKEDSTSVKFDANQYLKFVKKKVKSD